MTRTLRALVSVAGVMAAPTLAAAQSETTTGATVTTSAGYSSNPFVGNGGGAGFVELRVQPTLQLRSERDTLTVNGDAELQQYFRRYGTRDNYSARLGYVGRRSERLTLTGSASYLNAISGSSFNGAVVPEQPIEVAPDPVLGATDLGLFGTGNRRQSLSGQAGATYRLSAYDQINVFANAITTSNSRPGLAVNYQGFGGGLGYSRRLSERLQLGVRGLVNTTSYAGDIRTTVYGLEATFDARLSERWTLNGSAGAQRVENSGPAATIGSIPSQTTLSGRASLCRLTETGQLCLGLSRAILPSSFGGARIQSTADVSYRARLDERSSITARSSYTDVGGGTVTTGNPLLVSNLRYWTSSLGYRRRLGERLDLSATAQYRDVGGGGNAAIRRNDDAGGTVGLALALGRIR